MIKLVLQWAVATGAVMLAAYLVPGIEVDGWYVAFITALILGLINLIVRPVLVLLTLPITLITLGLFLFVINAALLLFVASFVEGFAINGFIPALLGSLVIAVVRSVSDTLLA